MLHDNKNHLDDAGLHLLVYGDEDSREMSAAAAHVETCDVCLQRLNEFAGTDDFGQEAAALLSDCPLSDTVSADRADESVRSSSTDFLSPPSHPEMLGRLGRYEIERVIGAGGMGVVLKGYDSELNRPVAVKVLARHLAHSGAARRRFAREARAAAAVVHEHVVAIHNVETDSDDPFLVMQYVHGESLQSLIDREGPLDTRQILRIGIQAAAGLAAAHEQGVIHRDIKPANILLEEGVQKALLTDFGLARTVDDAGLTHTGIVTGTPHYMSPEQANGEASDQRTDLFSLGSVLYFMATGHPPFRAEKAMGVLHRICNDRHRPAWEVNSDIDDELSDVIDRLLQKRPSRRIGSASQLRETLASMLEHIQHRRPWSRRMRRAARSPLALTAVAGTVVAAAVGISALVTSAAGPAGSESGTADSSAAQSTPGPSGSASADAADAVPFSVPITDAAAHTAQPDPEPAPLPPELAAAVLDQDMENIRTQLQQLSSRPESAFQNSAADSWNNEVSAVQFQLDQLEQSEFRFERTEPEFFPTGESE